MDSHTDAWKGAGDRLLHFSCHCKTEWQHPGHLLESLGSVDCIAENCVIEPVSGADVALDYAAIANPIPQENLSWLPQTSSGRMISRVLRRISSPALMALSE